MKTKEDLKELEFEFKKVQMTEKDTLFIKFKQKLSPEQAAAVCEICDQIAVGKVVILEDGANFLLALNNLGKEKVILTPQQQAEQLVALITQGKITREEAIDNLWKCGDTPLICDAIHLENLDIEEIEIFNFHSLNRCRAEECLITARSIIEIINKILPEE